MNRIIAMTAKRSHLQAVKRGAVVARQIDEQAARVRAALQALAKTDRDAHPAEARRIFDLLTVEAEKLIRNAITFQTSDTYKAMVKAIKSEVPNAIVVADVPEELLPDKRRESQYLGSIGSIAAVLFLAMMNYRRGDPGSIVQAEQAIDRIAGRARNIAKAQTIAAGNRAIVTSIENTYQVPVAKRLASVRVRRGPIIVPADDVRTRLRFAMPLSPGGERGTGRDVEIVPTPQLGPRDTSRLPPVDPNPPRRTRSMTVLVGWQVISMLDERVRPKHAERHGMKYYYDPKYGEHGLDKMPNPPYESPQDGGVIAFGCRCLLLPIIEAA